MAEPITFPVEVTVGRVKVTVTLLLRPGTVVEQANNSSTDSALRSSQSTSGADDEGGQVGGVNAGQGVADK